MTQATILDLTKKLELNLNKAGFTKLPTMAVKMAIDKSGSMDEEYEAGFVSKAIELFMAAGAKFDDNGQLEYTFFNSTADAVQATDVSSYESIRLPRANGGTNYLPALQILLEDAPAKTTKGGFFSRLFGKPEQTATNPVQSNLTYIAFLTDGDASDSRSTVDFIKNLDDNVFVQFIALGTQLNLQTLETLGSRPNTASFTIPNPRNLTADELYSKIANDRLLAWVNSK